MVKIVAAISLMLWMPHGLWASDDPFLGRWKEDPAKAQHDTPSVTTFAIKGDEWTQTNSEIGTHYTAKPDGREYPVTGNPSIDIVLLKRIDDHTIERTFKKAGSVINTVRATVSQDGNTLTSTIVAGPISGTVVRDRVGQGSGANVFDGSWRENFAKENELNPRSVLTITKDGDSYQIAYSEGLSYSTKMDGKDTKVNKMNGSFVALKRIDDRTIEESFKQGTEVIGTGKMMISADGKTLTETFVSKKSNGKERRGSSVYEREP